MILMNIWFFLKGQLICFISHDKILGSFLSLVYPGFLKQFRVHNESANVFVEWTTQSKQHKHLSGIGWEQGQDSSTNKFIRGKNRCSDKDGEQILKHDEGTITSFRWLFLWWPSWMTAQQCAVPAFRFPQPASFPLFLCLTVPRVSAFLLLWSPPDVSLHLLFLWIASSNPDHSLTCLQLSILIVLFSLSILSPYLLNWDNIFENVNKRQQLICYFFALYFSWIFKCYIPCFKDPTYVSFLFSSVKWLRYILAKSLPLKS